jgi:hypothetical protein
MTRLFLVVMVLGLLSGCAYTMQLLPRDGGTIYAGNIQSNGMGSGTLSVNLGNRTCSGSFAKGASNDSFGFFQTYGKRGASSVGSVQSYGSTSTFKALMTCSDGTGLRCDVEGGDSGTGICVDSRGQVLDMIYTR